MPLNLPIYMDNQSTTRVDPRVLEAMLPFFSDRFGNAGSTSHSFGWDARDAVDTSRKQIAQSIGASPREVIFTSGATESNNLAIRGVAERRKRKGNHIVSVTTEHQAVLDPFRRLARSDYEIDLLPVVPNGRDRSGTISAEQVEEAIRDDTVLVSVMLANNETGVIQPLHRIGEVCKRHGVLLHSDATQAVGKLHVNVQQLQVDLMSFSAHKIYGPKGIGGLYVRRRRPNVRLEALFEGGGQEFGLRSGTLNVVGCVGFAAALELCQDEISTEQSRLQQLRDRLFNGLSQALPDIFLNGPRLDRSDLRLPGNLNLTVPYVDGEALMMSMGNLAISSGSACTSADPQPSHVLRAMGLSDDATRSSLRFGLGRFNTAEEVEFAIEMVVDSVNRLRSMSSMN